MSMRPGCSTTPKTAETAAIPDAKAISEGLFPEDACEQLKAAGFKCMGFKPAVRYSLPATSFKLGSAELPETLKKQLEVFAEVRARPGAVEVVWDGAQPGPLREAGAALTGLKSLRYPINNE